MRAARRDLPALTRLWQACFGDTEAEVRAFWQALFDCTPVYLRRAPDWQMIDTIRGTKSSAIIYSIALHIVETAKANHSKSFDYVEYLLEETQKHMDDKDCSFLEIFCPGVNTVADILRERLGLQRQSCREEPRQQERKTDCVRFFYDFHFFLISRQRPANVNNALNIKSS